MGRKKVPNQLTPTQRVNKSIKNLVNAGGKRVMLRLTPEGYDALKTIMAIKKIDTETRAIKSTLIETKQQLLSMPAN